MEKAELIEAIVRKLMSDDHFKRLAPEKQQLAVELLRKWATGLGRERLFDIAFSGDVFVVEGRYKAAEDCYVSVRIWGKYEIIDRIEGPCFDGPAVWNQRDNVYLVHAPAVVMVRKAPDRVYRGWLWVAVVV